MFKNNYFYYGGNITVNPFQPLAAILDFVHHQKFIQVMKDCRKKESLKVLEIIDNREKIADHLKQSYSIGMTPLMMSSLSAYVSLGEFCGLVQNRFNHLFVADIRKLNLLTIGPLNVSTTPRHTQLSPEILEVKYNLAKILAEGGLFVISIDESISDTSKEETQIVSTLNSLYNPKAFPHGILSKDDLMNPSIYKKVLQDTEFSDAKEVHPNAVIMVWCRLKIDTNNDRDKLIEKIKRKYERVPGVREGIEMTPLNFYIIGQ